jgi:hypothetical protein
MRSRESQRLAGFGADDSRFTILDSRQANEVSEGQ